MTVEKRTLADDENYRIVFTENTRPNEKYRKKILVGFGEIGAGIDSQGFGSVLAGKLGISYVTVNQAKRTQYQFLSRESLTAALAPLQTNYDLYFYGTSLGGYAAAYYARPLGANFLALSPRLPIHPITDKRIPIRFRNSGYLHSPMDDGFLKHKISNQVVLYDPHNSVDSYYVQTEIMNAYPEAEYHVVANAGHYVPRALLISGALKNVVTSFLDNDEISFVLKEDEILEWNRARFKINLEKKRFGHASEHLEVLIAHESPAAISRYTRELNDAMVKR